MRRGVIVGVVAATTSTVALAGTVMAYAGWSVPGRPAVLAAKTAAMPAGVVPGVSTRGATAVVTWRSQEIGPGTPMQRYIVTAHSVVVPARPDIVRSVPGTARRTHSVVFTAAEVAGGRWYWTVRPVYESWQGADGRGSTRVGFPVPTSPPSPHPAPASPGPPPGPPANPTLTPTASPAGDPEAGPPSPIPPSPVSPSPSDSPVPTSPSPSSPDAPDSSAGPPPPIRHPPVPSAGS